MNNSAITPSQHIHLDVVGGIAGDMFIAALLSARSDLMPVVDETIIAAGLGEIVTVEVAPGVDHHIAGLRFNVSQAEKGAEHRSHASIQSLIKSSNLAQSIKDRASTIFQLLAEAEAKVHGCPADKVEFHELGAWDSIADIIIAAALIDALGETRWSISSLPLGEGVIMTQHGELPLPVPATALLLEGFVCHNDGQSGERITPTGAALIKYLQPLSSMTLAGVLDATGIGLGSRPGKSNANMLRILLLKPDNLGERHHDIILSCRFEIDDQSPESLAVGLEYLRACPEIIDVCQFLGIGKKGRTTTQIQVLAHPAHEETVLSACFAQTTTLGIRVTHEKRRILPRQFATVAIGDGQVRVKEATRPDGCVTRKAEIDDLRHGHDRISRESIRVRAENGGDL